MFACYVSIILERKQTHFIKNVKAGRMSRPLDRTGEMSRPLLGSWFTENQAVPLMECKTIFNSKDAVMPEEVSGPFNYTKQSKYRKVEFTEEMVLNLY